MEPDKNEENKMRADKFRDQVNNSGKLKALEKYVNGFSDEDKKTLDLCVNVVQKIVLVFFPDDIKKANALYATLDIAVEKANGNIKIILIVKNSHLGAFQWLTELQRFNLVEVCDQLGATPGRVIKLAVHQRWHRSCNSFDGFPGFLVAVVPQRFQITFFEKCGGEICLRIEVTRKDPVTILR